MNMNRAKNYMIIFLSLTAIYLTGQLWFDKISNHNFFYSFLSTFTPFFSDHPSEDTVMIKPARIITNFGNKTYTIQYNEPEMGLQKSDCDEVLSLVLKKGNFTDAKTIDWDYLLNHKGYIYDYPFAMPANVFASSFGQKGNNIISKMESFDNIHIIPSRSNNKKLKIIFVNEEHDVSYEFSVDSSALNDKLTKSIQASQDTGYALTYASSKQQGLKMFEKNTYIPEWSKKGFSYPALTVSNPYEVQGNRLLSTIEPKIDIFFENPSMKNPPSSPNGIFTFSDENIVVKYYPNDVLEYSNYSVNGATATNTNWSADYAAAIRFISYDKALENEYYLADYKTIDNGTVFYFQYAVNQFPILLSEDFSKKIGMNYPIEITISNHKTVKYKKLVYTFHEDEASTKTATIGFIDSLDDLLTSEHETETMSVDQAKSGYMLNKREDLILYWFIEMNHQTFSKSTQLR